MKFPNIEIRKTLSLVSMLLLGFTLVWSLISHEKEIAIMCLTALIGCINWYFSKSTALDKPE